MSNRISMIKFLFVLLKFSSSFELQSFHLERLQVNSLPWTARVGIQTGLDWRSMYSWSDIQYYSYLILFSLWGTVYRIQWRTTKLIMITVSPVQMTKASTREVTLTVPKPNQDLEEWNESLVQSFEGRSLNLKNLENKCVVFRAKSNLFSSTKREF